MVLSRLSPARLLTVVPLILALAVTMFASYTISPAATRASAAVVTAEKASSAADWARSRKGDMYRSGGAGPSRFDCSGLTRWAYSHVGKALPHSSSAQAGKTKRIKKSERRRGDLVFFYGYGGIYHVAIYAGHNQIWHASRSGTPVKRDRIWTGSHFYGRVK